MQESGESVFTSVLSSGSLIFKFLGDRKSQNSAGIVLIHSELASNKIFSLLVPCWFSDAEKLS